MGHKVNPSSLRIGGVKPWQARWFFSNKRSAVKFLEEDELLRRIIQKRIGLSGIAGLEIERTSNALRIYIKAARPGLVIGQGGKGIEELTRSIERAIRALRGKETKGKQPSLSVNVEELKRSEVSAQYVAQQIAWDLERRMPFRWIMKKYLEQVVQNREIKGAKITLSGRLNGAEIARQETLKRGSLPLQTLRADIDYGQVTAFTTYGTIGVKVWVYKGEVFSKAKGEGQIANREP